MLPLKFNLKNNEENNTKRINILYGNLKLDEDCEVLESNDVSYNYKKVDLKLSPEKANAIKEFEESVNYKKVVLKLSPEKADAIKEFEEEVNQYLEKHNIPKITILYGSIIYTKMGKNLSTEKLKYIKLSAVYVNDENKSFPQLWVLH